MGCNLRNEGNKKYINQKPARNSRQIRIVPCSSSETKVQTSEPPKKDRTSNRTKVSCCIEYQTMDKFSIWYWNELENSELRTYRTTQKRPNVEPALLESLAQIQ